MLDSLFAIPVYIASVTVGSDMCRYIIIVLEIIHVPDNIRTKVNCSKPALCICTWHKRATYSNCWSACVCSY